MIDPRAVIAPDAVLGEGVQIGAYTIIGAGVRIGAGSWIGPHAVINGPTTLGCENKVFQFASIGDAPQDKKYRGEPTRLEIGDRNVFREFCSVNRGTAGGRGVVGRGGANGRAGAVNLFHGMNPRRLLHHSTRNRGWAVGGGWPTDDVSCRWRDQPPHLPP